MKFAEHLSAHITPEWRKQYIQYEAFKEMLYAAQDQAPSIEVITLNTAFTFRLTAIFSAARTGVEPFCPSARLSLAHGGSHGPVCSCSSVGCTLQRGSPPALAHPARCIPVTVINITQAHSVTTAGPDERECTQRCWP
ncbi:hypothetical protein COCON_G00067230 [Conger conger]|uniref:SPX domain-containing protein n=1 Tax=Conger conger TaxID=82655 RepID=A0A9Q1DSM7_CONCO|nr:hypothetical protein COCON_G00067230 [Conger conger]